MSSVTSLRVSKGTSKFAPKAKPRPARRPKKTPTETEQSEESGIQSPATETQPQTPDTAQTAAEVTVSAEAPNDILDNDRESIVPDVASHIPQVAPSAGGGIPVIGASPQQQQQQKKSTKAAQNGTPIVIGASSQTSALPASRRQQALDRRPSIIGTPAPIPRPTGRLASLSSPMSISRLISTPPPEPTGSSRSRLNDTVTGRRGTPSKRRRVRGSTPSSEPPPEPKLKTVDDYRTLSFDEINSMPMSAFCCDTRHGIPTAEFISRENENIKKIVSKSRGKSAEADESNEADATTATATEVAATPSSSKAKNDATNGIKGMEDKIVDSQAQPNRMAAQIRIVDGKVVIDTDSLVVSRSDMGGGGNEPLEVVDESKRNQFINSLTYVTKRGSRKRWSKEETEEFYHALRKYGTDFEMISRVMPGRSRYDIRNKFKSEEKIHGNWITNALLGRPVPIAAPIPEAANEANSNIPSELANYSMANSPEPAPGSNAAGDERTGEEQLPGADGIIETEAQPTDAGGSDIDDGSDNTDAIGLGLLTPPTQAQ